MNWLLEEAMPFFWCPGCGNGIIMGSLFRTLESLGRRPQDVVAVTGIGCWGKADDYVRTNSIHGTHGRALAFATGVKAANPKLTVLALMGDGDCATIGGNHFLHAARRNLDMTAIVANNFNYGMTGGQYSATTPSGTRTSTSAFGNPEDAFDLCAVAKSAGAAFVARSSVYHVRLLDQLLAEAISHVGFSLVEVVTSCPVHYGRRNEMESPVAMMRHWREVCLPLKQYQALSPSERQGRISIGRLHQEEKSDFMTRYRRIQRRAKGGTDHG